MPKLLFVSPELPFPPQSGGKIKSLRLLDALAERHEVTLATPLKLEDARHRAAFEARSPCVAHFHRRVDVPRSARSLAMSYLKSQPLNVYRSHDAHIASHVRMHAAAQDILFIDHYEAATYLPESFRGPVIYHAHNAYHQIWERYASVSDNPAIRLASRLESNRVRRAELNIARRADLVFASPNDAELLVRGGVNPDRIADTYHLGDDSQLDLPALSFEQSEKRLMYVGLLSWEANVQGLLWFLTNVWPLLRARHPDLTFDIVGKNPDARLRSAVACFPGVELLGFVEDLESVYCRSRVSVAPLLFGSGMKVKVLDAMARGMPTATTPVGAEGIAYRNHEHLAVSDSANAMAQDVHTLLSSKPQWEKQMRASRQLIGQRYTWRRLFDNMHREIDSMLARREVTQSALRAQHA